jgi:NitT/TauT family transport system permease protein
VVILLAIFELVGATGIAGKTWPTFGQLAEYLQRPVNRGILARALVATSSAAGAGFVIGSVAAAIAASIALLVPPLRPGLDRLAGVIQAIPLIALAPVLASTVGRTSTPTVIVALGVSFVMFVAFGSGFNSASGTHNAVFSTFGSSKIARLWRLQLPAALPTIFDGFALAAPTAVLGAMIGEWFGAPRGLGVLVVSSMQNFQIALLWSAAFTATALSLVAFLVAVNLQALVSRRFA